jgi:hypothetical protein
MTITQWLRLEPLPNHLERAPERTHRAILARYDAEPASQPYWDEPGWVDGDGEPLPDHDPDSPDGEPAYTFAEALGDDFDMYLVEVA